MAIHHR
jgi:transposase